MLILCSSSVACGLLWPPWIFLRSCLGCLTVYYTPGGDELERRAPLCIGLVQLSSCYCPDQGGEPVGRNPGKEVIGRDDLEWSGE
jgi:hypothetical protein